MATDFSKILFFKHNHTYHYDGRTLPSVTSLVNRLKPPFDSDYWAQRKAEERGVEVSAILAEWAAKRLAGFERGTVVHEYIADVLIGSPAAIQSAGALKRRPEMDAFDKLWTLLCRQKRAVDARAEWIVGDSELGFAGTADAVLYSDTDKLYHLWDWKTGDKFRLANRFQTLLSPFADLDECEWSTYSLQVSLYRLAIERNTDVLLGDSYLAHLDGAGEYSLRTVIDLRERAEAWLRGGAL